MNRTIKKSICILLTLLLALSSLVFASAFDNDVEVYTSGDFEYTILEDNTVSILKYTGSSENVVIPSTIDNKPVTAVDDHSGLGGLLYKSISIPSSVTYIGYRAFSESFLLEDIHVDENNPYYSSDENGVLYNKDKTVLILYPVGNKRANYSMPDTVRVITDYAFEGAVNLKTITLSENLETIGDGAFIYFFQLQDVSLPDSVKQLGEYAFAYCLSFENSIIPETIEFVGKDAFYNDLGLDTVTFEGMNTQISRHPFVEDFVLIGNLNEYIDLMVEYIPKTMTEDYEIYEELLGQYMQDLEYDNQSDTYPLIDNVTIICHAGSTAENYADHYGLTYELKHFLGDWSYDWDNLVRTHKCKHCEYEESEPLEQTENNDVEIISPLDEDTEFIVEEILNNDGKYAVVEQAINQYNQKETSIIKIFDITYNKNGVHVQPNGTVKVKLPLDWEKDGNYKVYRVNDDGTLTDMEAVRQGSHMVFETDHFSIYVIVDEAVDESQNEKVSFYDFIKNIIDSIREFLKGIVSFFRSIGDRT